MRPDPGLCSPPKILGRRGELVGERAGEGYRLVAVEDKSMLEVQLMLTGSISARASVKISALLQLLVEGSQFRTAFSSPGNDSRTRSGHKNCLHALSRYCGIVKNKVYDVHISAALRGTAGCNSSPHGIRDSAAGIIHAPGELVYTLMALSAEYPSRLTFKGDVVRCQHNAPVVR